MKKSIIAVKIPDKIGYTEEYKKIKKRVSEIDKEIDDLYMQINKNDLLGKDEIEEILNSVIKLEEEYLPLSKNILKSRTDSFKYLLNHKEGVVEHLHKYYE